jgi:hypothetical protein
LLCRFVNLRCHFVDARPHRYFPTEEPWIKLVLETSALNLKNFFAELKRRNVYKVAVAYAVVGWLLVQVATQVFPFLEIPNWVVRLVIALVAIGFPIALVIAWAFELTPEGLKRTEDVDLETQKRPKSYGWNLAGLAEIQARTGATSDAVENLRRLLTIPAGETVSIARLKIDPIWDPIRNDPGFQKLLTMKEHVGQ